MPFRVNGPLVRPTTTISTNEPVRPAEPRVVADPRLVTDARLVDANAIRSNSTIRVPKTGFDGVKRTGTDDDSLGGGVALKQKGIYDAVNEGLVGADTDPDRLALRDAIWDRLETPSYLRTPGTVKPVDVKKLGAALAEATSSRQAASLSKLAQANPAAGAHLGELLTNTRAVAKDVRASLINTLATDAGGVAGAVLANLTGTAAFSALSAEGKAQLATVLARLDEKGLSVMGALLENVPEALAEQDALGNSLLSSLSQLATQPLNAALTGHTTTEELLSNVLLDVMNPNRIEQGTATTCTVASMQFELVADEPAEYARLMAGLAGPKGVATMKGGGDLRIGPGDADERARDGRSVSQTLFQSATMEYANGRFSNYDPVLGVSVNERTGEQRLGLKPDNQQALLEKLFGVKYSIDRLFSEGEAAKALAKLVGWDSRGFRNRPIVVDLDQGKFNHAVTLESVSKEKVVFRDPYGVLRSMPASTFPKVAVAIHLPTDVKLNGVS